MLPLVLIGASAILGGLSLAQEGELPQRRGVPSLAPPPGQVLPVRLTGYYPFKNYTSAAEAAMEGGPHDASGRQRLLITLQQHLRDPRRYPYASASGDLISAANPDGRFAYGQRVIIPALGENVIIRIVDTGSHFYGPIFDATQPGAVVPKTSKRNPRKVIRTAGHEPIDVACDVGQGFSGKLSTLRVVPGDVLDIRTGKPVRPLVA